MTTEEAKTFTRWAKEAGIQSFSYNGLQVVFWAPEPQERIAIDLSKLDAPPTTEDLYGYDIPEDLKDPDDEDHQ